MAQKVSDKKWVKDSFRVHAAMCSRALNEVVELACIGDGKFLKEIEGVEVLLNGDEFPGVTSQLVGYGVRAQLNQSGVLVLYVDISREFHDKVFPGQNPMKLKEIYFSPVLVPEKVEIFNGVVRILEARVERVLATMAKPYGDSGKVAIIPISDMEKW